MTISNIFASLAFSASVCVEAAISGETGPVLASRHSEATLERYTYKDLSESADALDISGVAVSPLINREFNMPFGDKWTMAELLSDSQARQQIAEAKKVTLWFANGGLDGEAHATSLMDKKLLMHKFEKKAEPQFAPYFFAEDINGEKYPQDLSPEEAQKEGLVMDEAGQQWGKMVMCTWMKPGSEDAIEGVGLKSTQIEAYGITVIRFDQDATSPAKEMGWNSFADASSFGKNGGFANSPKVIQDLDLFKWSNKIYK